MSLPRPLHTLALTLLFAVLAAVTTVLVWSGASLFTPEPFAIDKLSWLQMWLGPIGPLALVAAIYRYTRAKHDPTQAHHLRFGVRLGVALVLLIELPYLVVLSLFSVIYGDVRM